MAYGWVGSRGGQDFTTHLSILLFYHHSHFVAGSPCYTSIVYLNRVCFHCTSLNKRAYRRTRAWSSLVDGVLSGHISQPSFGAFAVWHHYHPTDKPKAVTDGILPAIPSTLPNHNQTPLCACLVVCRFGD